jgi:hypothetical protein
MLQILAKNKMSEITASESHLGGAFELMMSTITLQSEAIVYSSGGRDEIMLVL